VAIDRTSKFAVARLYDEATRRTACQFLEKVLIVVPYKLHTLLTDNSIQFAEQPRNRDTILSRLSRFGYDLPGQQDRAPARLRPTTRGVRRVRQQSSGLLPRPTARSSG